MSIEPSLAHVLGRIAVIEARVRLVVASRREDDPAPDDPFRGLYLSDEQVDRLLAGHGAPPAPDAQTAEYLRGLEEHADSLESQGADLRLRRLAREFGLEPLDVELLLVAIAPDLDSRFERLYGYLHDDVTRRRASIGLALELAGVSPSSGLARQRLTPTGPLIRTGLITVDDPERPFLTRSLQVPDRLTAHLLGDDSPDPDLSHLETEPDLIGADNHAGLARVLAMGGPLCYLREKPGSAPRALAVAALADVGRPAVVLDLGHLASSEDPMVVARVAARDARLRGAGVVAGPIEALSERGPLAVRAFAELAVPVILIGKRSWEPGWSAQVPVLLDVPPPSSSERAVMWRSSMNGDASGGLDPAEVTMHFRLAPDQVGRAARAAKLQAVAAGDDMQADHLRAGARAQNAAGLEALARRVEPGVGWNDLVLPPPCKTGLLELASRARLRDRVIDEWSMRPGGGRGRGITALFAGDSGTGKTMSAEVIAGELGLDMYSINLATVVDKYVGRRRRTSSGSSPRPTASTACCCSTRRTRSSGSDPRSATPTTATPTSKWRTCCSGWNPSTVSPSCRRTSARTSMTRSPAASTRSSTSRCLMTSSA